jgi:hypothetical protein
MNLSDDQTEARIPLASGTTAAAARAAGLSSDIVPVDVPDHFHAHVSVSVKERIRLGDDGDRISIEQAYSVEWLAPATWVRLVAEVFAAAR